jgi:hypothetical protein
MVSARANEYIARFTTKGAQKKTIIKKIVEYRDECKGLYHEADAKMPRNYPAEVAKKEYLSDMIKRIECLAEARDYLQEQIDNKKAPAKKGPAMSAVRYTSPEETTTRSYEPPRPTKESYYSSSPEESVGMSYRAPARPSKQNKKAAKEAKRAEVRAEREANAAKLFKKTDESNKYILRFQHLGLEDLDVFKCAEAAEKYMAVWEAERERNPDDEEYQERADEAISDLQEAIDYFENLSGDVAEALSPSTYNASNDEYVDENSLGGYGSSDNEDEFGNRYD